MDVGNSDKGPRVGGCRGGGFYPGTGQIHEVGGAEALGKNLNIPWPRGGFGDADYITSFDLVNLMLWNAWLSEDVVHCFAWYGIFLWRCRLDRQVGQDQRR